MVSESCRSISDMSSSLFRLSVVEPLSAGRIIISLLDFTFDIDFFSAMVRLCWVVEVSLFSKDGDEMLCTKKSIYCSIGWSEGRAGESKSDGGLNFISAGSRLVCVVGFEKSK